MLDIFSITIKVIKVEKEQKNGGEIKYFKIFKAAQSAGQGHYGDKNWKKALYYQQLASQGFRYQETRKDQCLHTATGKQEPR